MITIQPQRDAEQSKSRCFRFTWPNLLILTLLLAASVFGFVVLTGGLPLSWTADYDKEKYMQIRTGIAADKQRLLGKSLAEVSKQFDLEVVPWDDASFQQMPPHQYRIYHFRGFAFYITVDVELPKGLPVKNQQDTSEELRRYGVLRLAHQYPFVRIDGLDDRQERMKRFWKVIDEECERINAKMELQRQQLRK